MLSRIAIANFAVPVDADNLWHTISSGAGEVHDLIVDLHSALDSRKRILQHNSLADYNKTARLPLAHLFCFFYKVSDPMLEPLLNRIAQEGSRLGVYAIAALEQKQLLYSAL